MERLEPAIRGTVLALYGRLEDAAVDWALTGSASFALQGVPLAPNDVDVQTSEAGAYEIEERLADAVVESVSFSESPTIRSHFGAFAVNGVRVEVMGGVQKRVDGGWEPPVDVADYREFVSLGDERIPVLSLRYEARAYELLDRTERAALLREYVE